MNGFLYIEDNPANLKLVEQLIARRSDLCLLTAGDGLSGIALARAQSPEVILINSAFGGVLTNNGTFNVQCDASFLNTSIGYGTVLPVPLFVNNGSFTKSGSAGTNMFLDNFGGVAFNQNGIVDLRTGTVAFNGLYNLGITGSPQLKLVLGGTNAGTQFSQETFGSIAQLGGVLSVTLTNGFGPTNGQSFALLTYASCAGQFSSTQLPPLPANLRWGISYGANSLQLQVLPANVFEDTWMTNGNVAFQFTGQTGSQCLIEVSTNLIDWSPLFTNAPFDGVLNFIDPNTSQFSKRFYRAEIEP